MLSTRHFYHPYLLLHENSRMSKWFTIECQTLIVKHLIFSWYCLWREGRDPVTVSHEGPQGASNRESRIVQTRHRLRNTSPNGPSTAARLPLQETWTIPRHAAPPHRLTTPVTVLAVTSNGYNFPGARRNKESRRKLSNSHSRSGENNTWDRLLFASAHCVA